MEIEPRPDRLSSASSPAWTILTNAAGRIGAGLVDLIDPVSWAVEIIGGLLDLLA